MAVNLGRLGFVIKGVHKNGISYKRLDIVTDENNNVYASLVDNNTYPLSNEAKWYKMIPSNKENQTPTSNAVSQMTTFVETDDTEWNTIERYVLKNGNLVEATNSDDASVVISGHIETIVIPNNIDFGVTTKSVMFKLKHNCKFLKLSNNTEITNNLLYIDYDVFLKDDVWVLSVIKIDNNILTYSLTRIFREEKTKVVNCIANIEHISEDNKRLLAIHPIGEIGAISKYKTYQFVCYNPTEPTNLSKFVKYKDINSSIADTVLDFTSTEQPFAFKGKFKIHPALFDIYSPLSGYDYSNLVTCSDNVSTVFEYGYAAFKNSNKIPITFPQLYGKKTEYGSLKNLTIPTNEKFTIILIPNFNTSGEVSSYTGGCPFFMMVLFENVENVIKLTKEYDAEEQPVVIETNNYVTDLKFDFNGDGIVDTEDINAVINIVLGYASIKIINDTQDEVEPYYEEIAGTNNGKARVYNVSSNGGIYYIKDTMWDTMIEYMNDRYHPTDTIDVEWINAVINTVLGLEPEPNDNPDPQTSHGIIRSSQLENPFGTADNFGIVFGDLDFDGIISNNDSDSSSVYTQNDLSNLQLIASGRDTDGSGKQGAYLRYKVDQESYSVINLGLIDHIDIFVPKENPYALKDLITYFEDTVNNWGKEGLSFKDFVKEIIRNCCHVRANLEYVEMLDLNGMKAAMSEILFIIADTNQDGIIDERDVANMINYINNIQLPEGSPLISPSAGVGKIINIYYVLETASYAGIHDESYSYVDVRYSPSIPIMNQLDKNIADSYNVGNKTIKQAIKLGNGN